jgi:hypothetical protein
MLKSAWILPVVMLVALILAALVSGDLFAADRAPVNWARPAASEPPPAFKDLPGVVPEEERVAKGSYSCASDIQEVYIPRGGYDILYGDTRPRRVYHCTSESGVTYTGTQLPNTHWVPGLNPHHLPK